MLINKTLVDIQYKNLEKVGAPKFDEQDYAFATELAKSFDKNNVEAMLRNPENREFVDQLRGKVLHTGVIPPRGEGISGGGSTDVGDVSWITPTVTLSTATDPIGCPGHSWQHCASDATGIGLKAMMVAAKVQALTAIDLIEKPELLAAAKAEHEVLTKDNPYKCPFPEGRPYPVEEFFKQ
jgi:aminobenzoyl-glutamate utilization protein B